MDFREVTEFIKDTGKYIIFIVAVIIIFNYVISFQGVMGTSMDPTFKENDLVFVSKFHYVFNKVKRGEVIIFEYKNTKNVIKRVIGLPGEQIVYKNNILYINGTAYKDIYSGTTITSSFDSGIIPDKCYWVMGDNRETSVDSRVIGPVCEDNIKGKVVYRFWPLNKAGSVK